MQMGGECHSIVVSMHHNAANQWKGMLWQEHRDRNESCWCSSPFILSTRVLQPEVPGMEDSKKWLGL